MVIHVGFCIARLTYVLPRFYERYGENGYMNWAVEWSLIGRRVEGKMG